MTDLEKQELNWYRTKCWKYRRETSEQDEIIDRQATDINIHLNTIHRLQYRISQLENKRKDLINMKIFKHTTDRSTDGAIITDEANFVLHIVNDILYGYRSHYDILDIDTYLYLREMTFRESIDETLLSIIESMLLEYKRYLKPGDYHRIAVWDSVREHKNSPQIQEISFKI